MAAPVTFTRTAITGPAMLRFMPRFAIKSIPLAATLVVAFGSAAFAHPGHGASGGGFLAGLSHPFTGLDHLLAMVAVGLWASQLKRPALWTLPVVFPVMMALGAALGTGGLAMPWVEMGILLSVVVLGAAVALQIQAPLAIGAVLVAAFAVLHGYVHGAELPADGSAWLTGLGFISATLILHGIGIALGFAARRPLLMRSAGGAIAAAGLLLFVAH
jgi:urease accessory protein